jgi:hypothetical protein
MSIIYVNEPLFMKMTRRDTVYVRILHVSCAIVLIINSFWIKLYLNLTECSVNDTMSRGVPDTLLTVTFSITRNVFCDHFTSGGTLI